MTTNTFDTAHTHSSYHREEIANSEVCGCFYCLSIFIPKEIEYWVDEMDGIGQTAICPKCYVAAVIGSRSRFPITKDFLQKMHQMWF